METKHHCLDECNRCGEDCNCEAPLFNIEDTVYFGNWMKPGEILYGKIIQFITLANDEKIARVQLNEASAKKFGAEVAGPLVTNLEKFP